MIKKGGDEDEEEMEGAKKDGIYRPPKLAPVYNGNKQTLALLSAKIIRIKGLISNSTILRYRSNSGGQDAT